MNATLIPLLYLSLASFVLTLGLTAVIRRQFVKRHCFDVPDGERKLHPIPVPRGGGLAVFLSYALILGSCWLLPFNIGSQFLDSRVDARLIIAAIFIVLCTGLWDDLFQLKPWQKMSGLLLASLLVWAGGLHVRTFGLQTIPYVTLPITVIWLIGCANAFNLIDGMDGLAAGLGSMATLTILIGALGYQRWDLVILTLPLLCCLLAFLYFNFNPASIFLGDSGSLTLGFTLGCFGAICSHKAATLLGLTAPLIAFAIPLSDVALAIARRFLRNQPIFSPDAGHIHHRLLRSGMNVRRATLLLYGCAALASFLSLALAASQQRSTGPIIVIVFGILLLVAIQKLGYREFSLLKQFFLTNVLRRWIAEHTRLDQLDERLSEAKTLQEAWTQMRDSAHQFNLLGVRLEGGDGNFETFSIYFPREAHWEVAVPIADGQVLRLYYPQSATQDILPSSLALVIAKHLQRLTASPAVESVKMSAPARSTWSTGNPTPARASNSG